MKIDIIPYCGLGNRLNVLSSAIALQKATTNDITIYWEKTWDCSAWFDDLFCPIEELDVKRLTKFYMKSPGKRELWLPRLLRRFRYNRLWKARKIASSNILTLHQSDTLNAFIEGNRAICPMTEVSMLSRYYRPIPEIQQHIDTFTSQYAAFTVGVHVRRTDHKDVISNNPLEKYVTKMQEQLQLHPDCKFYIASDDESVKQYMRELFPGRIITNDNLCLERDTVRGIQDAVLELFSLGMTNLIIGSKGSTYSELAAKLYDSPIIYP